MQSFRQFLETQDIPLPPIPNGMIRLTHFTSEASARQIMSTGLNYGRPGLDGTTDPFSNNAQVSAFIRNHGEGMITRSFFGNFAVIVDLTMQQYRAHRNNQVLTFTIPSNFVAGYVSRDTGIFHPNPIYNPNTNPILQNNLPDVQVAVPLQTANAPSPTISSNNLDTF